MPKFNGHRNWTQWNVSLWINNDERLYRMALHYVKTSTSKGVAALRMLGSLEMEGITETPDGAKYSWTAIRHAMVDM